MVFFLIDRLKCSREFHLKLIIEIVIKSIESHVRYERAPQTKQLQNTQRHWFSNMQNPRHHAWFTTHTHSLAPILCNNSTSNRIHHTLFARQFQHHNNIHDLNYRTTVTVVVRSACVCWAFFRRCCWQWWKMLINQMKNNATKCHWSFRIYIPIPMQTTFQPRFQRTANTTDSFNRNMLFFCWSS